MDPGDCGMNAEDDGAGFVTGTESDRAEDDSVWASFSRAASSAASLEKMLFTVWAGMTNAPGMAGTEIRPALYTNGVSRRSVDTTLSRSGSQR